VRDFHVMLVVQHPCRVPNHLAQHRSFSM
jgi:hypothetical protein